MAQVHTPLGLVSFTFGFHCRVPFSLHTGKGNCFLWMSSPSSLWLFVRAARSQRLMQPHYVRKHGFLDPQKPVISKITIRPIPSSGTCFVNVMNGQINLGSPEAFRSLPFCKIICWGNWEEQMYLQQGRHRRQPGSRNSNSNQFALRSHNHKHDRQGR